MVRQAHHERAFLMKTDLFAQQFDPQVLTKFPKEFLEEYAVAPIRRENGSVTVYGPDRGYGAALEIGMVLDCSVAFVAAPAEDVRRFIREKYDRGSSRDEAIAGIEGQEDVRELEKLANDGPVPRLVEDVLKQAVEKRASDVHIEPYEAETAIRYRIDGVLVEQERLPRGLHSGVVSRIKILSRLDIAQTRLPQDGRITMPIGTREIDLRVSSIPTPMGERVVLRILDRASVKFGLAELGMEPAMLARWKDAISVPHGIILVTGPTGSGKTTTLYAAIETMRSDRVNILTVEDPVEYQIEGIGQVQVNPRIDLTFASGLRSLLRQDPDIIMVGEIRDGETARIAVQASLTGHLVLSTLHTNDAASAAPRLQDMGIEPYLLGSTMRVVLGQRLVRILCPACRKPAPIDPAAAAALHIPPETMVFAPAGCEACDGLGFKGRSGIFEMLLVEGGIKEMILSGESAAHIGAAAVRGGMVTLRGDGREKVLKGVTTAEEVLRATEAV